ncbi:MAG: ABC transporter [Deltaproteobacteria bacterium]|nr:MAG: ABC transporter [Deltaproteobacteria bacterium]
MVFDNAAKRRALKALLLLLPLFALLTLSTSLWESAFGPLFPRLEQLVYPLASFPLLVGEHLLLVGLSSGAAILIGITLGILVTRPWGRDLLPAASSLASMGQTFPPVAVLALAVPVVGFGFAPTFIALFLYGLLPILANTISGMESLDDGILEAARGMGMTRSQCLFRVELPLAAPVILAGVRISTVINTGTAALGATIGAGGLGKPIIAGLIGDNPAYILEGAILVALLAIIIDTILGMVSVARVEGV